MEIINRIGEIINAISTISMSISFLMLLFGCVGTTLYYILPYLGDISEPINWLVFGFCILIPSVFLNLIGNKMENLEYKNKK